MDAAMDELAIEDELKRNPYSVKTWWQLIQANNGATHKVRLPRSATNRLETASHRGYTATLSHMQSRAVLFERALAVLPGSYKLWYAYLKDAVAQVKGRSVVDSRLEVVNNLFERALVFMHKMPTIWVAYLSFLSRQKQITRTRRNFDRALQSLPVTQHDRIWPLYLSVMREYGVWETCVRVYRRYLMFAPESREDYVEYLLAIGQWDEAACQLAIVVNDPKFESRKGRPKHFFWMQLCDVVSQHPADIMSLSVEPILRSGISRFSDEVGRLWCALAEYFVRCGQFDKARDVYEEALTSVVTVRDFATVFDAYVQFEEALLTARLEVLDTGRNAAEDDASGPHKVIVSSARDLEDLSMLGDDADDANLRLARLELLMDRRPLLLSSVLLRQNPHNVHEWHKRAKIFKDAGVPAKAIMTYSDAVKTVDPFQANGKSYTLWVDFARCYEQFGDVDNARVVFRQATQALHKAPEDLASVWCEYAEMELRHEQHEKALQVLQEATTDSGPKRRRLESAQATEAVPVDNAEQLENLRRKAHRNTRLWAFYLDLEESLGTVATVRAAYDRAITLKVATVAMVINYATYLEERNFFEDSFRAYEKGVSIFPWPHVKEIWLAYLNKFVARYGGSKLERARDLFEQAVEGCPPAEAFPIYKLYAELEATHGLVRRAMAVLDRATRAVDDKHRYECFLLYISKAEENFGAPRTREIFERAVEMLPDNQVRDMCLRFAAMETKLGEIDRARAIFTHASQFCDPRIDVAFWNQWQNWELQNGTEDTFRDMLRVKRSVAAERSAGSALLQAAINKAADAGGVEGVRGGAGAAGGAGVRTHDPGEIAIPDSDAM